MKTDEQLKQEVSAELAWDPATHATQIGVAVKDGVVTLTGHIDTFGQKHAAVRAAQRVAGVRALAVELDVRLLKEHLRSDTELAANAEQALSWNAAVAPSAVRLTVERGWVTLHGEVDWDYQRRSVEKAIRALAGVIGISNLIVLRAQPQVDDLKRKIEEALIRQTLRESQRIRVSVEGHTVRLAGRVDSWHEREAAQGVAWSAPGVRAVINDLTVG
jgi:osmotically-inducible protein OsmY